MIWVGIIILVVAIVVFVNAVEKVKYGEFGETSWFLITLGIYQWGQGLLLSAFWMVYAIACMLWWTPTQAMQVYILFHLTRAVVELCLIQQSDYAGLAPFIAPQAHKIHAHQRIQLYGLCQGMIILASLLLLFPNIFI